MEIVETFIQFVVRFAAGWGVTLFLLWIRPEYLFLVFYVLANALLLFFFVDLQALTWADAGEYALWMAISIIANLAGGALVVALFKWLKTRRTGRDRQLDKEMEAIRAEIASRE